MKLNELQAFDVAAAWSGLSPERQAAIGMAFVGYMLADLVMADDGSETTVADRKVAAGMADEAFVAAEEAVEAAFPNIEWWTPDEPADPSL